MIYYLILVFGLILLVFEIVGTIKERKQKKENLRKVVEENGK